MPRPNQPVLVLGGGINGAAVARELALNQVACRVVDRADIASGATAYSSRLIHGGLRYLEYGELDLVRQSLAERRRWLKLAPQFVTPLRLHIPVARLGGGWFSAASRILGGQAAPATRGRWLVQTGLWMYDQLARTTGSERHSIARVEADNTPRVDPQRFRWLCSYLDAQVRYPECFVVAMLDDARRMADDEGFGFQVHTYSRAVRDGSRVTIYDERDDVVERFEPAAIVNATGAWIDSTLATLNVPDSKLIGGTKGSHLLTHSESLRAALGDAGVYAEAADGRPVFLLPLGDAVLIGTTDVPFPAAPETAVAADEEIAYLLDAANRVFPQVKMTRADVTLHYCGVRPLPRSDAARPGTVSRRHRIDRRDVDGVPLLSLIGGKLTTCRHLAEETVRELFTHWDGEPGNSSRDRPLPGAEGFPQDPPERERRLAELSSAEGHTAAQRAVIWQLEGTSADRWLRDQPPGPSVVDTDLPVAYVERVCRTRWVRHLSDLVERRLMLLYHPRVTTRCLRQLATAMVDAGCLVADQIDPEVDRCRTRLETHYGRTVTTSSATGPSETGPSATGSSATSDE